MPEIMYFILTIIIILFACWIARHLIRIFTYIRNVLRSERALQQFPSEPSHWLLGDLAGHPGVCHEMMVVNSALVAKYPRCYVYRIGPLKPSLQLHHPDVIADVLRMNTPKETDGAYKFVRLAVGESIFLAKGEKWKRQHKMLASAFTPECLKSYLTIFNKCTDTALDKIQSQSVDKKAYLNSRMFSNLLSLDSLLRSIFSADLNVQAEDVTKPNKSFIEAELAYTKGLMYRAVRPHLHSDFIYYLTAAGRQAKRYIQIAHAYAAKQMDRRKKEMSNVDALNGSLKGMCADEGRRMDVLDKLLLARDDGGISMSAEEIKQNALIVMAAGMDTTASTFSFAMYNLATHPEAQSRVRSEIDAILAGRDSDEIQWADLGKLQYLGMVLKETMRMYPPAWFLARQTDRPIKIDGKWVPEDTAVTICVWNLHHNPVLWENPFTFDPERFTLENCKKRALFTYMPFAIGDHSCIGKHFAMNEMKTVMARIVHRFELSIDPTYELKLYPSIVLRTDPDIPIMFRERNDK